MNREQESLLENLNLIYRLKEQAETHQQESDMLLSGMRAILVANDSQDLYEKMFELFRTIIPYEVCFVLDPHKPGSMTCTASTDPKTLNSIWTVDTVLKKAVSEKPLAIFNAKSQPAWVEQERLKTPSSVLYLPFRVSKHKSIIVFCTDEIGFYTQDHVALAERYREFTEQTLLSVQAKLKALESEKLREEKEQVERSMVHSEKMASLGLLAAGIAHEINNPVAFIKSNVEFLSGCTNMISELLDTVKDIEKNGSLHATHKAKLTELITKKGVLDFADDLNDICTSTNDGVKRVTKIVSSLRTFTHNDENNKNQSFAINECLDNSLRLVASEFKNNIEVHSKLGKDIPEISGDPGKFNQVIVNLLVNAAQAMPNGGCLEISSEIVRQETETRKAGVYVVVKDNGCGIETTGLAQIFEPFYTTKPVGQGTGLGLYITFSLIESLGGQISADSEVNIGTVFTIFFPCERLIIK